MRRFTDRIFSPRSGSSTSGGRKMATSSDSTGSGGGAARKLHGIVNDLQHQKSPYLLQHKTNPVEWHPWSPATHQLAVTRSVPIFLSIGYSTCHWCHVMERESFENPQIAAIMNENFVNIKIDREEHPDIDRIYMSFVTAVSGSGGWPLSVWLTPSLRPIYGGTYYPPDNRYFGRPGFKSLLLSIAEQWEENQEKCEDSAANIFKLLEKNANIGVSAELPNGLTIIDKCVAQLRRSYEPSFGGFGEAPKFPQPGNFTCLIDYCAKQKRNGQDVASIQKMVERTLLMMASGGINDHVGKGFARYSTDKKWHVPHFEKMLYDQAQLTEAYALTYKLNGDNFYSLVTQDIVEYVMRDLSHPEAGFFSAEDADSDNSDGAKKEGAFYVWKGDEVDELLNEKVKDGTTLVSDIFKFRYGVKENGNVDPYQDPHDELKHQNVLFEANSIAKCAEKFGIGEAEVKTVLDGAKTKLFEWRVENRKRPGLDDKIIASWNGLMITALTTAAQALDNESYLDRAVKAMRFCKKYLITKDCDLYRTCYAEENGIGNLAEPIHGCVDDFANLVSACLGLFQASGGDMEWIELARKLQNKQDELYWDDERGGYFNSRQDPTVIIRMKDDDDGAEPSSNSTSLRNLLQLSQIDAVFLTPTSPVSPDQSSYATKITKLIKQFTDRLEKIPIALPIMSSLVHTYACNLTTTLIFDGNDASLRKQIGQQVMLPYGSAIVPVKNPVQVNKEYLVPGKIVKLLGQERKKEVIDSVENCR